MPKGGISLYFTIQDRASSVLSGIGDKTKALDKETQSLAQAAAALTAANKPLIQQQNELKLQLEKSGQAVKDARKAWQEYGDEASEQKLSEAIQEQDRLRRELKDTEDQLKSNQKTYQDYREAIRKGALEGESLAGGSGGGVSAGIGDIGKTLGGLGIGKMASDLAEQAAGALLTSALGDEAGSLISGGLSGAISGAALGTAIAPGIGTAIGAAVGGLGGLASGAIESFSSRDDAFKAYYQGLYDQFDATEAVSPGSTIAAGRESDLISFSTLFGDRDRAESYLADLVEMSNRTPFLYGDLTAMSKTLATYKFDQDALLPALTDIGDAGAALGMTTSDMTTVATALGRMQSSNKATLEYLNMLNDRGINAVGYLAEARGESVGDTYSAISKGEIAGQDAVQIILAAMEEAFGGSMEVQSQTFSGLSSTLEGLKQEIQAAAGEGYNDLRAEGIQAGIDAYSGPLGEYMSQMNTIVGENQAYLENLSEQYQRDALTALFTGEISSIFTPEQADALAGLHDQFAALQDAVEAGDPEAKLKQQELYELTQETAQGYYESSDIMQAKEDTELDHLAAIRENTMGLASALRDYRTSQESSKGMAAETNIFDWRSFVPEQYGGTRKYAVGLPYVPEDNFPALLHEGERVLTAREAREYDAGTGSGTPGITIQIAELAVREEADVERIAARLLEELELAEMAG